jgi:hypothetical protein
MRTSSAWKCSAHSPIDVVTETLKLARSIIAQFPKNRPEIVPI